MQHSDCGVGVRIKVVRKRESRSVEAGRKEKNIISKEKGSLSHIVKLCRGWGYLSVSEGRVEGSRNIIQSNSKTIDGRRRV